MDSVETIIERIGADTAQEKKAWKQVITGITTIVFCRLKRLVAKRPSYYGGLTDARIKARIRAKLVSFMLNITAAVNIIVGFLDYPSEGDVE